MKINSENLIEKAFRRELRLSAILLFGNQEGMISGLIRIFYNYYKKKTNIDEIKYLSLLMIGVFGVIGQIGLTVSYQLSKASSVAPYSYFYIIFSGLIGFLIWNEIPDILSIIGYLFIIISYYYSIRFLK